MSKSDALDYLRRLGQHRSAEGDEFCESDRTPGRFLYAAGETHAGVAVWGEDDRWTFSCFAAARIHMQPTLELYRYISQWRSTCGVGAPYVIEDGSAAVLCECTINGFQLLAEPTGWRMMTSTIDLVGESAHFLAEDLAHHDDGIPFTVRGKLGLACLSGWWEIGDSRITELMGMC